MLLVYYLVGDHETLSIFHTSNMYQVVGVGCNVLAEFAPPCCTLVPRWARVGLVGEAQKRRFSPVVSPTLPTHAEKQGQNRPEHSVSTKQTDADIIFVVTIIITVIMIVMVIVIVIITTITIITVTDVFITIIVVFSTFNTV